MKAKVKYNLKISLAGLMILTGVIFGPLPLVPAWALILGGVALYASTKPEGWRLPKWIDDKLPNRVKKVLYKDLRDIRGKHSK